MEPTPQTSIFPAMEEQTLAFWDEEHIFERSMKERPAGKGFVFYDGPPFATGLPHYGHLLQSVIKDSVARYATMRGYKVPRRWGWDCHGLPIENLIEKQLGLEGKRDIEALGIAKFVEACRQSVFGYERDWEKYVDRIGRWVDFKGSYKTMDDSFIESVWWAFSELYKKDLIYKGVRVALYCPRCTTSLSHFEIAMGNSYAEVQDPAIFVKFPVQGQEKTFFVAWTTTPWSLPGVTGLAVSKDLSYVFAKHTKNGETYIVAKDRLDALAVDGALFDVVETKQGSELVGMRVTMPYHFLPVEGDAYRVILGDHVTADAGTGVVTTAPAFGEEDLVAARAANLPLVDTLDGEGRMIAQAGSFAGLKAKEANAPIIEDLKQRGLLHREETIQHSIPICYRCDTHLLYRAQDAWFLNITKLKPKLLKTAEKIHWVPDHLKAGRFGKGLETAPDWNISRTRYWGSPLPVWVCTKCDERTVIGSRKELLKLATNPQVMDGKDLHKPTIDEVTFTCSCGGTQERVKDVFDCWFESGSMPFAQLHYPFEKKAWFEKNFPADFIAEAQDQTRGWFYTLHVLATALFNKPAFKNVIVTGMVLAEDGRKMSKKLKNYPDPWEVFQTYGADAVRYYLCSSPVVEAESLNFSEKDLQIITRGFMNLVWNTKVFYETYAPKRVSVSKPRSAHVLDRWLFARLHELTRDMTDAMDAYELIRAVRPLRSFVDDLSTWWLRRSRDRFKSENEYERQDALKTLREVLEELSRLMAPYTPFLAEKLYHDIGGKKASVHLDRWPKYEARLIDERLLEEMRVVRDVCSKTHEARSQAKIPVRQTLASVTLYHGNAEDVERLRRQHDILALIREEVNVEEVRVAHKDGEVYWSVELDTVLTPELVRKGQRRLFVRSVMNLRKQAAMTPNDRVHVSVSSAHALREAVEEDLQAVMRDLKADAIEFVAQAPADALVTDEQKDEWISLSRS